MPWTVFDTTIGPCGIAWSDTGVIGVQLPEATKEDTVGRLLQKAPTAGLKATKNTTPAWMVEAIAMLKEHLRGTKQELAKVPLDLADVTPFAAKVYRALQAVPAGTTVTYGELAGAAGSAGGSRAVGRAMGTNPVPLLVACHRVLASGGKPGGFSAYGGRMTKEKLLAIEGARTAGLLPDVPPLPYDGANAVRHLETDRVLAAHIAKIPFALALQPTEGTFAALAESIVYQQLNGRAAATIFGRLRALFPKGRLEPRVLLALSDEALRGAGLSRGKLAAIRDLAARAEGGEIPTLAELARMDDDAIVATLTPVRGIGRWTVEMLLIFRLGRPDVLPVDDYGVKKGFARLFHPKSRREELPKAADLVRRAERWRPYRSVASWYLWRAADLR